MDNGIIYFTPEEIYDMAAASKGMAGFPLPDGAFREQYTPIACTARLRQGEALYLFFVITLPEAEAEGVTEELWMNAALTAGAELLEREWLEEAEAEGQTLSPLYAPGIGEMPLTASIRIADFTGAEDLGVQVDENGLMHPAFTRAGYYVMAEELPEQEGCGCSGCLGGKGGCGLCQRFVYNH